MLSQPFQADTNERASAGGDSTCLTAPPAKSLSAHRAPDPPSPTATRRLVRPTRVTSGTGTDTVSPAGTLGTQKTAAVDPVLEWPDLSGAGGKAPTRQGQTGVQQTLAGMELFDPAAKDAGGLSEDARKTWGEGFKSVSAKPAQEGSLQRWWEGVKYASRSEPAGQAVLGPGQAGATASTSTSASGQVTAVTTGPKSATPRVGGISDQPLTETISSSGSTAHAETSKELAVPVLKAEPDTDQRLEDAPTQNAAHTLRAVEQRIASTLGPSDNQSPTRYAEAVARCCAPATTTPMGKAQGAKKRKVNVTPAPADARQSEALDREEKRVKLEHAESATDSATGSGSSSVPITPAASTLATATTAPGNVIVTASHPSHPLLKGKVPGSKAYRKAERQILAAQMAQDARAANAQASGSTVVPAAVSYSSAPPSAQSGGGRADVNPVGVSAATRTPAIGTASTSVGMTTTTAKKIPTGPAAQTRASVANANAAGIPSVAQKAPAAPRLQTGVAGTSMNLAPANDVAGKKGDVADSRRRQDIAQKVNASVSGANDAMSTGAGYDRMEVDGGDGRSSGVRADVEHDKVSGAAAVLLSTTTGSLQPTPPTSDRHATSAPCPTPASINASTAPGGSAAQVAPVPTPRPPVNLKQVTTQLAKLHAAVNAFELDIKAAEADSDREKAANEQGLASAKAEAEAAKVAAAEARAEGGRATAELDKMRAAAMAWMKRAKAAEAKVMRLEDADKVAVAAKVVADGELRDIKEKLEESERRGNAAVKNLALVKASLKLRDESWKPGCFDVGGVDVSAAPSAASSRSGTGVAGQPAGRATPVGLVSALEIGTATPPVHQSTTLETPATTSAPANTDLIALRRSLLLARTDLSKEQKRSSALQQQIDTQAGEIKLLESDLAETKRQARMGELRASIVAREHDKRVARLNEEREVQLKELEAMMRVIEALEGELRSKEGDGTGGTESGTMDQET